ncbi:MAG: hypothetical protein RMY62_031610 [Nostoc sp. ZfuVER08]|jgi:hypothetical protein|uniref:Uncharacterized protein n=1 Tax=Nostoc punctiforme FACHB-252 TaxID=1357509 RepID=A0ABR8HC56_NOSPU|nr:hypothetical protein [Nostoc punctiforme]MBD2613350.1 hypothetical protein [Nostoc punctiforme FACHB-252]MBL1199280.1 hypothetical protein [Nostoc sp. GBBB01]MDZ8011327.1 hypothetical protein [Nostoc sp. ZfuVER08]
METKETIEFPGLPLAVYREIAAHLRQVEGVEVDLIPQSSQQFDYNQSQIDGLGITRSANSTLESQQRVNQILAYYQNRYLNPI